jgi:hypothetical protein
VHERRKEMDPTVFGRLRLIWEWYNWGVFVAFVLALAATFWVFFDSQRRGRESILWKVVAVVSLILVIPSVILRIDPTLALSVLGAVEPLAYLGILAGVAALITIFAYSLGVAVQPSVPEPLPAVPYAPPPPPAPPPPAPPAPAPPPVDPLPTAAPAAPPWSAPGPVAGAPAKTELLRKEPPQLSWLIQRSGPRAGREYRLGELTNVGRDASQSDIVIDDSTVSRQHARVRLEEGRFVLYDLASSNGTFVNDQQIQKQPLLDGDRVRFGSVDFNFMEVKQPTS